MMTWVAAVFFFSCTGGTIYDQYREIKENAWEKGEEYSFSFTIDDHSVPYNVTLNIRNSNRYPYRNLWLFYSEEPPIGPVLRDTVECLLADEYGKWYGRGISLYQSAFSLKTNHVFPRKGEYRFWFMQGMRTDTLRGIQEIGLKVERAD
jgi:gliding motility-associated lipoprotein GldH